MAVEVLTLSEIFITIINMQDLLNKNLIFETVVNIKLERLINLI